nr:immunoglobulin light chain junction region [Macaca mulatta]MOW51593.1 immunoglobulin light chain junction region [Macaca mulatta]MOW51606.1 immunoglobulin light chain junction region [Macaca mulatta]MOW51782.1 immunoglobulin light chain junction region [Macaca mulatta]MOW52007.1 immunoglobulin light chain junction region [Macaca mulatta]
CMQGLEFPPFTF